ncbi:MULTISPECIES: molybdopterin converting factor subunit 1 [Lysinibacillus]|uniref:Molybdopterin synthase sulfur carrier subunit n=1 Tax=Lysinibacillus antri TaxID=2498145 RepID=A0A3S0QPV5_9BACI|nr:MULTISPECIES: molybdopterin converting factor subunit 1 [Lysinibacillus]RUL52227.1 molybdopterin converting factor subunit 1 [Lysinibacillus antri]TSI05198.1 molybdopterin converting factor subunit 1 [Lysinibacillus sp. BW-2-10]
MVTILYFARLKEIVGKEQEQLPFEGRTVKELLDYIEQQYDFSNFVHVAVNEEYALLEDTLQEHDTVAIIPPVSGG